MSNAVKANPKAGHSNARGKDAKRKNIKKRKDATKGAERKVVRIVKSNRNAITRRTKNKGN